MTTVNGRTSSRALVLDELRAAGAVGISAPLGRPTRSPDAAREARLALKTANAEQLPSFTYGEGRTSSPFVPRSVSDAEAVVETMLGPLRDYDAEHEEPE